MQHLVKKWTGIADVVKRLQIFSTDEYGKPSLDFITSFSTFTVGNSLCTHPALLHARPGTIPTVELYYHLKVPIYPYAPMTHYQSYGNQVNDPLIPHPNHNPHFQSTTPTFQLPLAPISETPQIVPSLPLSELNLASNQQQSLYPLNAALSKMGRESVVVQPSVSPQDNRLEAHDGVTLGKRLSETDNAPDKRLKEDNSQNLDALTTITEEIPNGVSLLGTETMHMLDGLFSPEKTTSSCSRVFPQVLESWGSESTTTKNAVDESLLNQNSQNSSSPLFDTSSQYDGQSIMMGTDTIALFENLNSCAVPESKAQPEKHDEQESAQPEKAARRAQKPYAPAALTPNTTTSDISTVHKSESDDTSKPFPQHDCIKDKDVGEVVSKISHPQESMSDDTVMSMLQSFISPEKSQPPSRQYFSKPDCQVSSLGTVIEEEQQNELNNDFNFPMSKPPTSESIVKKMEDKSAKDDSRNSESDEVKSVRNVASDIPFSADYVTPSPVVTGNQKLSSHFSHISVLSTEKCAGKRSACDKIFDGDKIDKHDENECRNHSERTVSDCVKNIPNSTTSVTGDGACSSGDKYGDENKDEQPKISECRHEQSTHVDIRNTACDTHNCNKECDGKRSPHSISHKNIASETACGPSVFSCQSSSVRSSGGIPLNIMRRNNRKPHMKRINPTFIRKLAVPI